MVMCKVYVGEGLLLVSVVLFIGGMSIVLEIYEGKILFLVNKMCELVD